VANPVASLVENVFTRVHLVAKMPVDGPGNFGCARVKTLNHGGLHQDELVEPPKPGLFKPRMCSEFKFAVFFIWLLILLKGSWP
jgi:hypothetical protein